MLRSHGLDDETIFDVVEIVGFFSYINQIVDALGVALDTNSPREKNRLNSGVIGRKLFDRYNDSVIDEPLKSESKGSETPDTDKIA